MVTSSSITTTFAPDPSASSGGSGNAWDDTYKWLLGWGVAIVVLSLLNKTRLGHVFIYYWLWGLLIFLFVTQYKFIVDALGPIGTPAPTGGQK